MPWLVHRRRIAQRWMISHQVARHAAFSILLRALPRSPLYKVVALVRLHAFGPGLPLDREVDGRAHHAASPWHVRRHGKVVVGVRALVACPEGIGIPAALPV